MKFIDKLTSMISCSCIQLSVACCAKHVMMYFVVVISLADSMQTILSTLS